PAGGGFDQVAVDVVNGEVLRAAHEPVGARRSAPAATSTRLVLAAVAVSDESAVVDPGVVGDRTTGAVRSCGGRHRRYPGTPGDPAHAAPREAAASPVPGSGPVVSVSPLHLPPPGGRLTV